jgi:hypothetical protein
MVYKLDQYYRFSLLPVHQVMGRYSPQKTIREIESFYTLVGGTKYKNELSFLRKNYEYYKTFW